jgi:hypothetical protein
VIFNKTLNTKDKVNGLATLIEEIQDADIINISHKETKIQKLSSTCFFIENFINDAIEYSKMNYLKEERVILLIEDCKELKAIQKSFEKELLNLGSYRNLQNEKELRKAFDFELNPIREINLLPNSIEIEKRIRKAILNLKKDYKDESWFKVGLLFAKGEMAKFQLNERMHPDWSAPKIAKELNLPNCEKYFLGTLNEYKLGSKNIFNNLNNLSKIIEHCKTNEILICKKFIDKFDSIKSNSIYLKK